MTWLHTPLTEDQLEIVDLVRGALPNLPPLTDAVGDDSPSSVAAARAVLVESGLWSIGIDDELGGGGAPFDLRQTALIALGAGVPALAWASAQAHAAASVVGRVAGLESLCADIVEGSQPVCVVELDDPHVRLAVEGESVHGVIGRLDPAGESPAIVVLDGDNAAWVFTPDAMSNSTQVRRTGLAGALTISSALGASSDDVVRVDDLDLVDIRSSLHLAGAAIAAGIAVDAVERALEYSHQRVQFGAPLTALPTVRASLAEQTSSAAEAISAALLDSPGTAERAAAALRDNCDRAIAVSAAALQSHGGYGYLAEYEVERLVRDAVSLRAATGASGVLRRAANALVENRGR